MLIRTYATLGFYGISLDPLALAETMEIDAEAFRTVAKGKVTPLGVAENAALLISSQDVVDGTSVDEHVMWLIELIAPHVAQAKAAVGYDGATRCFVFCESDIENADVFLAPETLRQLAALNCSLSVDVWTAASSEGDH